MYYKHETDGHNSITIRHAREADSDALERLAERDSAPVPTGDILVAAVGGEIRVAVRIADGSTIADPFHPTASLVRILSSRAAHLRGGNSADRPRLAALLPRRRGRARLSPQPAGTLHTLD